MNVEKTKSLQSGRKLHLFGAGLQTILAATILALFAFEMFDLKGLLGPQLSQSPILDFIEVRGHWIAGWVAIWGCLSIAVWLVLKTRLAVLTSGLLAMGLAAGLWIASRLQFFEIEAPAEYWGMGLSVWTGALACQFARLGMTWEKLKPALIKKGPYSETEERLRERGFREHFVYLSISLAALVAVASQLIWMDLSLMERKATDHNFMPALGFAILIGSAFVPLTYATWRRERLLSEKSTVGFWRNDVITPFFLGMLIAGVLGVTTLAYFAASYATSGISAAISYATFIGVLALFTFVIVLPHVLNFFRKRSEDKIAEATLPAPATAGVASLAGPAKLLSRFDTLLVKIVAPLSGGTQTMLAHVHVIAVLTLLSMLGLIIPRPYGIVPIVIGIMLAISLGRRWAWIEEDRETASRLERTNGPNIHLGFENDLKDEALLGYAGLFILVPLTLYQLQDITLFIPPFEEQRGILLTWVVFFGGELAKAVPFVDWWDIYGDEGLTSTGKHLTFVSRAAVDLVILAALFQALKIWERNRVQTRLYEDGHLDAFDPFKEQEFFEQGIVRIPGEFPTEDMTGNRLNRANHFKAKIEHLRKANRLATAELQDGTRGYFMVQPKMEERVKKHVEKRQNLLRQSTKVFESAAPYSRRRLGELIQSQNCDLRAGARWMVERWDVLVGDPIERLYQLAIRWDRNGYFQNFLGDDARSKTERRIQKNEFERILVELGNAYWNQKLSRDDIGVLVECLKRVNDDVEFEFSRILAFEVFSQQRTLYAVMYLSKFVLKEEVLRQNDAWRHQLITYAGGPDYEVFLGRSDMRERVYDAAYRIFENSRSGDGAKREALELLKWMAHEDKAASGKAHAEALVKKAYDTFEQPSFLDG